MKKFFVFTLVLVTFSLYGSSLPAHAQADSFIPYSDKSTSLGENDRIRPDTVYYNGIIYTMTEDLYDLSNTKPNTVELVATKDGKIIFAGSTSDAKERGFLDGTNIEKVVNLHGKVLLPGFIDVHGHFPGESEMDLFGVNLNSPPLGSVVNMADMTKLLKLKAENMPKDSWIMGENYDDSLLLENRHPSRDDLDKASVEHYVVANHSSGHMKVVNSRVVDEIIMPQGQVVGNTFVKDGNVVEGVVVENGRLTGLLKEINAMNLVAETPLKKGDEAQLFYRGSQVYASKGVTLANQGGSLVKLAVESLQDALRENNLTIRVSLNPVSYLHDQGYNQSYLKWDNNGTPSIAQDDKPSLSSPSVGADLTNYNLPKEKAYLPENYILLGSWKQIYDGSNQGYTGYFKIPGYWDKGDYLPNDPATGRPNPADPNALLGLAGSLNFSRITLIESMDFLHKNGQSVAVHVNGAWAAEDFMTAIELAVAEHPEIKDSRHTFIHGQTQDRQIVERAVGEYANINSQSHMYENLSGTAEGISQAASGKSYSAEMLREALGYGQLIRDQNLISSYFIDHIYYWGNRHLNRYMGEGLGKQQNPQGWALAYDHLFTSHNDTPITPISPLRSVQSSVTRTSIDGNQLFGSSKNLNDIAMYPEVKGGNTREYWDYDQRINTLQALQSVTSRAAYQSHVENLVGSIEEGKLADFVILAEDPLKVGMQEPFRLADIRVMTTIVDDEPVYGFLPDDTIFVGQVSVGYGQAEGVEVRNFEYSLIRNNVADCLYSSVKAPYRLGSFKFKVDVTADKSALMQFHFLGNGENVGSLDLYNIAGISSATFQYGKPVKSEESIASGVWWVSSIADPFAPLAPHTILKEDTVYIAFYMIRDGDKVFDSNTVAGFIDAPMTLTARALPRNNN